MTNPLVPLTLEADVTLSSTDSQTLWNAITAQCPLPEGKTIAEISGANLTVNPATKALRVQIRFSS